ncbi:hypothetical protein Zmor_023274 [Zophobas morio]|uniref:Uncharacterized protein n=1 Tax=Zophobas morio TaxID=2755281 RepID=A0AA38HXY8_9CUCU|nr:hypothetical protein Zmor_023274 [Zophobas morio]
MHIIHNQKRVFHGPPRGARPSEAGPVESHSRMHFGNRLQCRSLPGHSLPEFCKPSALVFLASVVLLASYAGLDIEDERDGGQPETWSSKNYRLFAARNRICYADNIDCLRGIPSLDSQGGGASVYVSRLA